MRHAADITKIKILAGESVDKTQLEGTVTYDIIFLAKAPRTNDLIRYLSLLLNKEMPVGQREKELENEYHLQMTEELRKDVGGLCNYSDAMLMLGRKEGIEIGQKRGIEIGQKLGQQQGAVMQLIRSVRKGKYTVEEAAEEAGMTVKAFKEEMKLQAQSQLN